MQYRAQVRLQAGRVEMIQDLQAMAVSLLRAYRKSNGDQKAKRVIFYRDGVSEGQFDAVVDEEVAALKAAFRELDPKGPAPKLTYVVCGKRHHLRFYAKAPAEADRTGNLPAGTVVDRGVTSAVMGNFYLQAHAGLVGTARPTHYSILVDENAFTADRLQQLTFNLCHAYARATRSVSLVPPAYYACVRAFITVIRNVSAPAFLTLPRSPTSMQRRHLYCGPADRLRSGRARAVDSGLRCQRQPPRPAAGDPHPSPSGPARPLACLRLSHVVHVGRPRGTRPGRRRQGILLPSNHAGRTVPTLSTSSPSRPRLSDCPLSSTRLVHLCCVLWGHVTVASGVPFDPLNASRRSLRHPLDALLARVLLPPLPASVASTTALVSFPSPSLVVDSPRPAVVVAASSRQSRAVSRPLDPVGRVVALTR
jgi:hypothetical protein